MWKDNEKITLSGQEAIDVLFGIEYILILLRDIAKYYYTEPDSSISAEMR